jgi:hypothetical protein
MELTDLDRVSLERVLPTTRGPSDWDDVLRRSRAHETRRRRVRVLAATALVLAAGTASALAVRAALDGGRVNLPPAGATASRPMVGTLVLNYYGRQSEQSGWPARVNNVWIYADGRLIWRRESGPYAVAGVRTGFLEQRLTREGVERLRSHVLSTRLFNRDRKLVSANGLRWGGIGVRTGGRWVTVAWAPRVARIRNVPGPVATRKQAGALSRLAELLADPRSGLPPSAWKVSKVKAYVPSRYAICYWRAPSSPPLRPSRILGSLPAAARDLLRGKTRRYPGRVILVDPAWPSVCSEVTTDEARTLGTVLRAAGFERKKIGFVWTNAGSVSDPREQVLSISSEPILPHGRWVGAMGG